MLYLQWQVYFQNGQVHVKEEAKTFQMFETVNGFTNYRLREVGFTFLESGKNCTKCGSRSAKLTKE